MLRRLKFANDAPITHATHHKWHDVVEFRTLLHNVLLTEEGKRSVDPANVTRGPGESLQDFVYRLSQAQLIRDELRRPEAPATATDKRNELLKAL